MAVAKHAELQDWNSKSPCATERLAKNILQSPRLDGVNLPADSEQRSSPKRAPPRCSLLPFLGVVKQLLSNVRQVASQHLRQVASQHLRQVASQHLRQVASQHLRQVASQHIRQVASQYARQRPDCSQ